MFLTPYEIFCCVLHNFLMRFPYEFSCFLFLMIFSCEIVCVVEGKKRGRGGSIRILENYLMIRCRYLRVWVGMKGCKVMVCRSVRDIQLMLLCCFCHGHKHSVLQCKSIQSRPLRMGCSHCCRYEKYVLLDTRKFAIAIAVWISLDAKFGGAVGF
jgi:hypothetical protein